MSEQLELFPQEEVQPQGSVSLPEVELIADAEWCFQFFNNEPVVFAYQTEGTQPSPLSLQIKPEVGESLNFQQNGMMFKIFPRAISEETKLERENASKNKED